MTQVLAAQHPQRAAGGCCLCLGCRSRAVVAAAGCWGWREGHPALPPARGQSTGHPRAPHPATPPLGSHPKSCWSSPSATGSRGLPPSCSSRLCSFFATKLNLGRAEGQLQGARLLQQPHRSCLQGPAPGLWALPSLCLGQPGEAAGCHLLEHTGCVQLPEGAQRAPVPLQDTVCQSQNYLPHSSPSPSHAAQAHSQPSHDGLWAQGNSLSGQSWDQQGCATYTFVFHVSCWLGPLNCWDVGQRMEWI